MGTIQPEPNCPGADVAENQFALRCAYFPGLSQRTGSIVPSQVSRERITKFMMLYLGRSIKAQTLFEGHIRQNLAAAGKNEYNVVGRKTWSVIFVLVLTNL